MTLGTTQPQRLPQALRDDLFRVDETTTEQRLAMSLRLAERLRFVDADGQPDGVWSALLEYDESVLIARARTLDLERRGEIFLDDYAAVRRGKLTGRLNGMRDGLEAWSNALALLEDRPWARVISDHAAAVLKGLDQTPPLPAEDHPDYLPTLRSTYFALSHALTRIEDMAREAWKLSLASGVHDPAAALLIAFCQMLGRVQERINQFTERLTDFYYHDCLRMAPRAAKPDSVHLLFERDPAYGPPVVTPAGAVFLTGPASGPAVQFVADSALTITDLKVQDLRTLRLQRDRLITPECRFGYATRAKVDGFDADVGRGDDVGQVPIALLGADERGATRKGRDARIGLAIASPVLWLKEGEREVRLTLTFEHGDERIEDLLEAMQKAPDEAAFSPILGRLFARWVLPQKPRLDSDALAAIRARAAELMDTSQFNVRNGVVDDARDGRFERERHSAVNPFILMLARQEPGYDDDRRRSLIRDELVENVFDVALSTADGWHKIYRPVLVEAAPATDPQRDTMCILFALSNEDPPITPCSPQVHGDEWPTEAPILRLRVNQHAAMFPYSLLGGAIVRALDLQVKVSGVRDVQAYNQLGPLDPTRPFAPFGPLPNTASYLVVGAPELARKYVTSLTVLPEWAALPAHGFEQHYEAYDEDFSAEAFTVDTSIMRDGLWGGTGGRRARLFVEGAPPQGLPIAIDLTDLRARWRPDGPDFQASANARNSLVKLQLATPAGGFGHEAFPPLLTRSVSAKRKVGDWRKTPLPQPPYTPLMERLTLSYTAGARIELGDVGSARAARGEAVLHLHPFGLEEIHPASPDRAHPLVPACGRDGNLFIGLSGAQALGVLTLFFDLRRDAAVEALARRKPRPKLEWSWLAGDRWRPLEHRRILSDTTAGFLTAGIVALDLPPGMTNDNRCMPDGLFWLRLSCDAASGSFATLKAVRSQALRATRVLGETAPEGPLAPGSITLKSLTLPGVLALEQPEGGIGLRRAETVDQFRTRAGERLRHKQRASTPWDYERLVLEAYPGVHKVLCLPNREDVTAAHAPGKVLVVVVPNGPRNDPRYATRPLRANPLDLDAIEAYLRQRASPAVELKVRSASYDLIQVRCRLSFKPHVDIGDAVRRINAGLISHLSPWYDTGRGPEFGWEIGADEIEACIRRATNPGDVVTVKGISMLHVWERAGLVAEAPDYGFEDTASTRRVAAETSMRIANKTPWSLALPIDEHFIEVEAKDAAGPARPTGVSRGPDPEDASSAAGLQLGRTFVVGGRPDDDT